MFKFFINNEDEDKKSEKKHHEKEEEETPEVEESDDEMGQLSVDAYETDDELILVAPIAGVSLDEIELEINEDILVISGERKLDKQISKEDYVFQECYWGKFSRSIVLPENVDQSDINASFKDGVLKITLPKTDKKKNTKSIKINK